MDKSMNVLIKLMIAEKVIRALVFIVVFLVKFATGLTDLMNKNTENENDTNEIEVRQRIIIE